MNGFAEAAIGLAFASQLLAVETVLTLHFLDGGRPQQVQSQPAPHHVATQKLMRNPWERR